MDHFIRKFKASKERESATLDRFKYFFAQKKLLVGGEHTKVDVHFF